MKIRSRVKMLVKKQTKLHDVFAAKNKLTARETIDIFLLCYH